MKDLQVQIMSRHKCLFLVSKLQSTTHSDAKPIRTNAWFGFVWIRKHKENAILKRRLLAMHEVRAFQTLFCRRVQVQGTFFKKWFDWIDLEYKKVKWENKSRWVVSFVHGNLHLGVSCPFAQRRFCGSRFWSYGSKVGTYKWGHFVGSKREVLLFLLLLHPGKLTWQWQNKHYLKVYLLLKWWFSSQQC